MRAPNWPGFGSGGSAAIAAEAPRLSAAAAASAQGRKTGMAFLVFDAGFNAARP
jgi:hypothetical protein